MQQNVLKKRRKSETWELSLSLNLSFPNSKASLPYFRLQTVFYSSKNANSVNSSHLKSIPTFLNRNVTFRLTVPPRISLRMFVHLKYIPELPTTKKANAEEKDLWISWWDFSEAVPRHSITSQLTSRGRVAVAAAELLGRGPTSISCTSSAALRLGATLLWHQNKTTCDFFSSPRIRGITDAKQCFFLSLRPHKAHLCTFSSMINFLTAHRRSLRSLVTSNSQIHSRSE